MDNPPISDENNNKVLIINILPLEAMAFKFLHELVDYSKGDNKYDTAAANVTVSQFLNSFIKDIRTYAGDRDIDMPVTFNFVTDLILQWPETSSFTSEDLSVWHALHDMWEVYENIISSYGVDPKEHNLIMRVGVGLLYANGK